MALKDNWEYIFNNIKINASMIISHSAVHTECVRRMEGA